MSDLAKRVEVLETQLQRRPDKEWQRTAKLGLLWLCLGIIIGVILEQSVYGLDRLAIPQYWWERPTLIQPYLNFHNYCLSISSVLVGGLVADYLYRRDVNKRERSLTSKIRHLIVYVLFLVGGVVGVMRATGWIESTLWQTFKGVI